MNYISAYKTNPEQPLSCPGLFYIVSSGRCSRRHVHDRRALRERAHCDGERRPYPDYTAGACQQGGDLFVRLAGYSRIQGNSRLRQSCTAPPPIPPQISVSTP